MKLPTISDFIVRRFNQMLEGFQEGSLKIIWPNQSSSLHGTEGETVTVTLHNYDPIRKLVLQGSNGFAESYMNGHWDVDDIDALFRLFMRNEELLVDRVDGGWLGRIQNTVSHALNRNSRTGSKKNINFHYDLGNAFYQLWLDPSMTYSSAVFKSSDQTLEQAQRSKIQRVIELLEPEESSAVLEIGCGWGALSKAIASDAGCSVEALSLSQEQLDYARDSNSVGDRINYRYTDYRDVRGSFDRIVSIEMFEAVGVAYWERYFDSLNQLLKSGGSAVLQVITIAEDRFEQYCSNPDFIQRYIFPGGMLPTRQKLDALIDGAGFKLEEEHWFGQDYAMTLARWRESFESKLPAVRALGYDDRFIRMWRYYLAYCETGFSVQSTNVGMVKLVRR